MRWSIMSQAVQAKAWRERPLRYTFGLWMPKGVQILQNPLPRSTRRGFLLATSKSTKNTSILSESSLSLSSNQF